MLAYATRRLAATIPLLLIGTFIVYWLVSQIADPLGRLATCNTCDQSAYDRLIELYDLDQSVPVRYTNWISGAVTGDFGVAPSQGEIPVADIFWERAKNSAIIAVPAFMLVASMALLLGVFSAIRQYKPSDYAITSVSFLGIAFPTFFLGVVLQIFWGIWWPDWTGTKPFFITGKHTGSLLELVQSATLPIITLATVFVATESRFARASMLEVINSDYIRTARAKGLSERRVILRHGLRNAMIPIVTLWALDFAALLGGSVVTESVFAWPGLGPLFLTALGGQDLNLMMAIVLFASVLAIVFNLLADLLYGVLDPRIRYD